MDIFIYFMMQYFFDKAILVDLYLLYLPSYLSSMIKKRNLSTDIASIFIFSIFFFLFFIFSGICSNLLSFHDFFHFLLVK